MKKVIITGGAGFIGSNLATRLLNENIEKLLIIDDLSTGTESNLKNILGHFCDSQISGKFLGVSKTCLAGMSGICQVWRHTFG